MVDIARQLGVNAIVHAFEPCAGTARVLEANLRLWGMEEVVKVNDIALSSTPGESVLHSHGAGQGRNSLHSTAGELAPFRESIRTETLDDYSSLAALPFIDIIKVDTEGHDLDVLRGAESALRDHRVGIAQFEYNHRWIAARHFLADAFEFLVPLGYQIGKVTPKGIEFYGGWHPELETFREANFVAVTEAVAKRFPQIPWWNAP
jgi:FkbM family methyltransferase